MEKSSLKDDGIEPGAKHTSTNVHCMSVRFEDLFCGSAQQVGILKVFRMC